MSAAAQLFVGCWCLARALTLLQASCRRSFASRVGRAAAVVRVRIGARHDAALCMVAPGLAQSSIACASRKVVSSRDKYVSQMGVRTIRTSI